MNRRILEQANNLHYGELYSPLRFSAKSVIGTIEESEGRRQPMATLCHHMDVCEVVTIVRIAPIKHNHKIYYNLSTDLYETKSPWFLVTGHQFNDSEPIFLILNDQEEFYPIFKLDGFLHESGPMLPYFILSNGLIFHPLIACLLLKQ